MVNDKNIVSAKFSVNENSTTTSNERKYTIKHVARMIDETESIVIGWRDKLCSELHLEESQQLFNEDEINRFKLVKSMKRKQNMKLLDIKRALSELQDLDSFTDERMINNETNGLLIQQLVKSAVQVEVANMMNDLKVSIVNDMSAKMDQYSKSMLNATMENKKLMYQMNNEMTNIINKNIDAVNSLSDKVDSNTKLIPDSKTVQNIDEKISHVRDMMEHREQQSKKSFFQRIFNK